MTKDPAAGPKVFVISPEAAVRQQLHKMLSASGTQPHGEATPDEAMDKLAATRRQPELVFFDAAGVGAAPVRLLLKIRMMHRLQTTDVVALFDDRSAETLLELLPFGLSGLLRRDASPAEWREAWPPLKRLITDFNPMRTALHNLTSAEIYRLHGQPEMVQLHQLQAQRLVAGRPALEHSVTSFIAGTALLRLPVTAASSTPSD